MRTTGTDSESISLDSLAAELRALKESAGDPSYGELVHAIMALRTARGMSEWEARVGRTTVYDAFREGRRTLDPELIGDIVRALGADEQQALEWTRRCVLAKRARAAAAPGAPLPAPEAAEDQIRSMLSPRLKLLLIVACVAVNMAGRVLVNITHMPLYLDMVGTAIAALIAGPWTAVVVGVSTSLVGASTNGWTSVQFTPVEIVGALIWGYGVRRFGLGRTVPRFFALNLIVALACTVVAVPIITYADHGATGNGADQLTHSMDLLWHNLLAAVAAQNVLTSIADKLISGFIALGVAESLPSRPSTRRDGPILRSIWLQLTAGARALPGARS